MPSPLLPLLAQEAPASDLAQLEAWWRALFGDDPKFAPVVAIPLFVAALAVASFAVERIASWFIRRIAAKTDTKIDDVFAEGVPHIVRAVLVFIALHVIAAALLPAEIVVRDAAGAITKVPNDVLLRVSQTLTALSYVAVGLIVTRIGLRMTDAWAEGKPHIHAVGPGIKFALKVLIIPVLLVLVLQAYGQKVDTFLTVLGVGSLAVALALQDVLKNIFAGVQLVMDQPVRAGDFIVLDDGKVKGTVIEIGLRSTKLRTLDNNVAILPNTTVANAVVTNMDMIDKAYAHVIKVGVAYGSDARRVEAVLQDEVDQAIQAVEAFADGPATVQFVEMADSALVFRVVVRLRQYAGFFDPVSELNHRIYARLRKEGIEIPFPTRTVVLRQEQRGPPPAQS